MNKNIDIEYESMQETIDEGQEIISELKEENESLTKDIEKYWQLEQELGCPLEIVVKVLKGETIICKNDNEKYYGSLRWNFYTEGFVFDLNTIKEITNIYIKTSDYQKTWWLEGEKDVNL